MKGREVDSNGVTFPSLPEKTGSGNWRQLNRELGLDTSSEYGRKVEKKGLLITPENALEEERIKALMEGSVFFGDPPMKDGKYNPHCTGRCLRIFIHPSNDSYLI